MRTVLGAVLFAIAGAAILPGASVIDNVWADYADSPDSTYIETAAIWFGIGLAAGVGGVLALRRR
jgi:hypothetical protein